MIQNWQHTIRASVKTLGRIMQLNRNGMESRLHQVGKNKVHLGRITFIFIYCTIILLYLLYKNKKNDRVEKWIARNGRISSTIVFSPQFQQGKQTENKAIAFLCFPVSIIEQRTKESTLFTCFYYKITFTRTRTLQILPVMFHLSEVKTHAEADHLFLKRIFATWLNIWIVL